MVKNEPIRQQGPLDLIMGSLNMMKDNIMGTASFRDNAMQDSVGTATVDTVCTPDTGLWETGIQKADTPWVIVEQYHNEEDAKAGHAVWLQRMTDEPDQELHDINTFGIPS